ncbi:hypothetical protein CO2235_MP70243 [Cupriavidus oxalaticus]|uniref:Uncharacterized protein n=1 Tax=Cupriavidus oxalaticus TaxID=96344 RepID=A0A976BJF8_9BURK|nr:hypothetical protein CO2235_MP70243 [Cupriavidus oxalaticus]
MRIQIGQATAFGAGSRVDDGVDQRGLARAQRFVYRGFEFRRRGDIGTDTTERFHHLVVARARDERRDRRIPAAGRIHVDPLVDAVVVENDDADRQVVAADRLDFHAREAERTVTAQRQHRLAGLDRGGDRVAHAHAHHAPGAYVQALARLVHVDHGTGVVQRVGAFVDERDVRVGLDHILQHAERTVEVHRRGVPGPGQGLGHLRQVGVPAVSHRVQPVGARPGKVVADLVEDRRHARTDVTHDRRGDGDVAVHLGRRDVDLDELLRLAPGLALAVRQQPVQAGADQQHHVGFGQHIRACGGGRLRVRIGQQALGHRHRQVRNARLLDQRADIRFGACVRSTLAYQDQRALGALQQRDGTVDRVRSRQLARGRIHHLDQRLAALLGFHRLAQQLGRQVQVHTARAARHGGTDGTRDPDADVFGVQHAEGSLGVRTGDGQLVHLFVVTLLQIDDLALARAADQDHREAVGGRMRQRREPVQEPWRRHGQANAWLLRQKAGNRCGVACVLLVAEADDAHAVCLRQPSQVGDRNAGQAVDVFDAVQLQRVDDQMKTIGLCLMLFRGVTLQLVSDFCHGCFLLCKLTGVGILLFQASAVVLSARFATTSDMLGLLVRLVFVVRGAVPLLQPLPAHSTGLDDIRYVIYQNDARRISPDFSNFRRAAQQFRNQLLLKEPNS